ncbi:MAG: LysM peptidoglycan-binding domain-containing protein [Verrucomicrobiales bacterium]|nr:LysM peptidoglycan-binding domain-containing protein [Verrucomicrobiales bacterium]
MEAKTTTLPVCVLWLFLFLIAPVCHVSGEQIAVKSSTLLPRGMRDTGGIPKWNYLLHLPAAYSETSDPWPMIFYLHGKSMRGNDFKNGLAALKRYGIPAFLDRNPDFPFVVVSPQLPEESWPEKSLLSLLGEVLGKYNVDRDRIYLTGVNIGGDGAWYLAAADQKRFAAVAPLCGCGDESLVPDLTDIPIWSFHGDADRVDPVGPHQRLVDAVNLAGGNAKITVIPGGTHGDIIFPTYQRQDLYDWFLSNTRGPKPLPELIAKPVPVAQPVVEPVMNTHKVKRGDTLWGISIQHKVSVEKLKQVNGLKSDVINIGQILTIPEG